jgi:hypothetical protein
MSNTEDLRQTVVPAKSHAAESRTRRVRVLIDLEDVDDPNVSIDIGAKKKSWIAKAWPVIVKFFSCGWQ